MTKQDALNFFYTKNNIDIASVCNPEDGNYDKRIAELDSQVDIWLQMIEPQEGSIFLQNLDEIIWPSCFYN